MFVFKLNPLGDPIFDKISLTRWPLHFEVTVTTWPVGRGYCKKKIFFKFSFKQPLNDNNCSKEIAVPNVMQTIFKTYRQVPL